MRVGAPSRADRLADVAELVGDRMRSDPSFAALWDAAPEDVQYAYVKWLAAPWLRRGRRARLETAVRLSRTHGRLAVNVKGD